MPFWRASTYGGQEQFANENKLMAARKSASSAVGHIIAMKEAVVSPITQAYLREHLLPFLDQKMRHVHHRVKECYAWVLVTARLVSVHCACCCYRSLPLIPITQLCQMVPGVVKYEEVMTYFVDKMCPVINAIQGICGNAVENCLACWYAFRAQSGHGFCLKSAL